MTSQQVPAPATATVEARMDVPTLETMRALFGNCDEHVRTIEAQTGVVVYTRETQLCVTGKPDAVALARKVFDALLDMIAAGEELDAARVQYALRAAADGEAEQLHALAGDVLLLTHKGKPIKCKNLAQKKYVQCIRNNTVVLGIGPAGTGKTYLAVAMAVLAYKNKEVSRIILTRPAVEAGEKLGFLPGDLQNKVDPYLRPLYDALYDLLGPEGYQKLVDRGSIEVAPLAYMRGRTLNESFIILDEAQNCTIEQMKMFLTRFGEGSKVVVNGDITQIDLPKEKTSGLRHAMQVLKNVEGIQIVQFGAKDVVRHEMVQKIITAYEQYNKRNKG